MSDLEKLTAERDALAATVEALRGELAGLVSAVFKTSKALIEATETLEIELLPALEDKEPLVELIEGFKAVVAATPQQHLAEIRAEAVESALDAVGVPCTKFKNHSADFTAGFNFCGAQVQLHADSIRKGEVE